jgi:predicted DNA-binding transcriptional regulator AlpA
VSTENNLSKLIQTNDIWLMRTYYEAARQIATHDDATELAVSMTRNGQTVADILDMVGTMYDVGPRRPQGDDRRDVNAPKQVARVQADHAIIDAYTARVQATLRTEIQNGDVLGFVMQNIIVSQATVAEMAGLSQPQLSRILAGGGGPVQRPMGGMRQARFRLVDVLAWLESAG